MRQQPRNDSFARRIEWDAVCTWVFCFGLVAYLGIEGGGYDQLVHDQVGIADWWVVFAGVIVGDLQGVGTSRLALGARGLFAAFVSGAGIALNRNEGDERTATEPATGMAHWSQRHARRCKRETGDT